ncbi:MAG: dihydroorotase, partial [Sulfurimonadaceae bacterium]
MKTHTLLMPLDMHLHLRDGVMLENIAPLSAYSFSGALVMPNLVPPVTSLEDIKAYKERIMAAVPNDYFEPYMTLFYKNYDKAFLESVAGHITAIKLYPAGITTNSEGGVSSFNVEEMRPTLEMMSTLGIPLCVHGETDGFVMDREAEFMSIYELLAKNFPKLK